MPKSFAAVSFTALALVVFGLFMSPRVTPHTVQTASAVVSATKSAVQKEAGVVALHISSTVNAPDSASGTVAESAAAIPADATLSIEQHAFSVVSGKSVLDTMRTLMSENKISFEETDYPSLGAFIDSIDGKKNAGELYWFLYVNGKPSGTGASQTVIHPGETVEWKYRDSY